MFKVKMIYVKSTKNTHMYGAQKPTEIPTLYIDKSAMPETPPKFIKVTVEESEDGGV